ncbi:MAG: hypothetical protein FWD94_07825 [Treponema sp.]|nr:hypothetical protein [Treponema sp.]
MGDRITLIGSGAVAGCVIGIFFMMDWKLGLPVAVTVGAIMVLLEMNSRRWAKILWTIRELLEERRDRNGKGMIDEGPHRWVRLEGKVLECPLCGDMVDAPDDHPDDFYGFCRMCGARLLRPEEKAE